MPATLIVTSQEANPSAEIRLEQFAHQLAGNHAAIESRRYTMHLLEQLQRWKHTLQAAYACFRGAPSKDVAFSRAG